MSAERDIYDGFVKRFGKYLKDNDLVIDIGKSNDGLSNYYKSLLPSQIVYKTCDIEPLKNPDIVYDIENTKLPSEYFNGVLCFGVWEMCNGNPFDLFKGLMKILKSDGHFVFGVKLAGYPVDWNYDYVRFTECGIRRLLSKCTILEEEVVKRDGNPTFFMVIGKK